jgi:hypothetical protein
MIARTNAEALCGFFDLELQLIEHLQVAPTGHHINGADPPQLRSYKKALITTQIDSLAKLRHPEARNRDRFIRFLSEFSDWPEGQLISIPILRLRLASRGLETELTSALDQHLAAVRVDDTGALPTSVLDLPLERLNQLSLSALEESLARKSQQLELLYSFRNFLLHEFRPPGYGMDSMCPDPQQPAYHGYHGEGRWYLAFPLGFFVRIARSSNFNFRKYLFDSGIDPYERVRDTEEW